MQELQEKLGEWLYKNDIGAGNWVPPVVYATEKSSEGKFTFQIGIMNMNCTMRSTLNDELLASKYKELTWYAPKDNAKETP